MTDKKKAPATRLEMGPVPYIVFPILEETGVVNHGFSTRLGGVSTGIHESMNLGFSRGDDPECVRENFRRISGALGIALEDMTRGDQTHTTNVRVVTEEDRGKGVTKEQDYTDIDGLVTNVPGICLVTAYADCVPLFFVDPVHRAIGLSHSGWRGTVGRMGKVTIETMMREYGTDPADLVCQIGPSICQSCYEVSEDVALEFKKAFREDQLPAILEDKGNGKYQLNLWAANKQIMMNCGVPESQIGVTDLCTSCRCDLLWSHRKTKGQRGGMSAFLQIKV